jgi:drug/metabolite transporter (DMT)-like permease
MKGAIQSHRLWEGVIFLSCFFFATGAVLIKIVSHEVQETQSLHYRLSFCLRCRTSGYGMVDTAGHTRQFTHFSAVAVHCRAGVCRQVLMSYGFKHTTATEASIITFFKIPLTLLLSFLMLHERMSPRFLIGALLIVAGLIGNSWKVIFPQKQ